MSCLYKMDKKASAFIDSTLIAIVKYQTVDDNGRNISRTLMRSDDVLRNMKQVLESSEIDNINSYLVVTLLRCMIKYRNGKAG